MENDRREGPDAPPRDRDHWAAWDARGGPVVPATPASTPIASSRRRWLTAPLAALVLLAALWLRSPTLVPTGIAPADRWDLQLTSAGSKAIPALVYGAHAGLHFVTLGPAPLLDDRRTIVPVALKDGDVWMISLGWSQIQVRSSAPPSHAPMSFGATGRIIRAYQHPTGTGVRVW